MPKATLLLTAFALINLWTFMLFGFDKLHAIAAGLAGGWALA